MRVLIAEDSALFREGLHRLLVEAGHEVIATVADADSLLAAVDRDLPDLAVIDVRMPPTMTDDGARAAGRLRERYPSLPMLLLSQHVETRHSTALVASGGFGYLLKDRVLRVDDFLDGRRGRIRARPGSRPHAARAFSVGRSTHGIDRAGEGRPRSCRRGPL